MLDGRGVSGKVNNFGLGLSAEVGKKFGLTKDFFVEPQAQLAYYWIKGKDFSMSNGMKVEQGDFNSWVGRLGLVAGKDFKDAEGNTKAQVFVKGGVKQQFAGKQKLYANSVQFKDEGNKRLLWSWLRSESEQEGQPLWSARTGKRQALHEGNRSDAWAEM